jgi:DNA-binding CsgD family transcriptional regulator
MSRTGGRPLLRCGAINGLFEGDLDMVRSASSEGARISREIGYLYVLELMLTNLGLASLVAGDLREAKPLLQESLRVAQKTDDRVGQFYALDGLACLAAGSQQMRLAAQLLGAAEARRTMTGAASRTAVIPLLARAKASPIASLGPAGFETQFNLGKGLSGEAIVRLGLGEATDVAAVTIQVGSDLLGKRQVDVARLVAEGLSNKQIGARLFISERTVESHVRSIMNKLGFNSRAQVAAWMASSVE